MMRVVRSIPSFINAGLQAGDLRDRGYQPFNGLRMGLLDIPCSR